MSERTVSVKSLAPTPGYEHEPWDIVKVYPDGDTAAVARGVTIAAADFYSEYLNARAARGVEYEVRPAAPIPEGSAG